MIRSLIATAAILAGALPRTLRAVLGDVRDSRQLAAAVRTLAEQRAALELLAASEQDRADAAERAGDALQRQLQAAEGAEAVQRAEMASIKRDLEVAVRDSLRYQDWLQSILAGGQPYGPEHAARRALSGEQAPKPADVAHPPTNGAPR